MATGALPPGTGDTRNQQKTHEVYEYLKNDVGPYRLIAELIDDKEGTIRINKLTLGKLLSRTKEYKENVLNMRPMGMKKLLVFVKSMSIANRLQGDKTMKENNYKFYVPKSFLSVTGVIAGVPADMTEDEILENMTCEVPIMSVYRLQRYINGQKVPSNRISVTFRTNKLPAEVKLYCCINRVMPFVNKPVLCGNCLRYGHKTDSCKSTRRCSVCSQQHEGTEIGDCDNKTSCLYCKKDHRTTDPNCPEWKKQRNIKTIMAKSNMTYLEAKELNPIFTQNRYELLEEMSEFPTPAESFADMAAGKYKPKDAHQHRPPAQKSKRPMKEVNIADTVTIYADKKQKTDKSPERTGTALFNRYSASDFERFTTMYEKQRQEFDQQQTRMKSNSIRNPSGQETFNQTAGAQHTQLGVPWNTQTEMIEDEP